MAWMPMFSSRKKVNCGQPRSQSAQRPNLGRTKFPAAIATKCSLDTLKGQLEHASGSTWRRQSRVDVKGGNERFQIKGGGPHYF